MRYHDPIPNEASRDIADEILELACKPTPTKADRERAKTIRHAFVSRLVEPPKEFA